MWSTPGSGGTTSQADDLGDRVAKKDKDNNEQKLPKGKHSRWDRQAHRLGQKWGTEPAQAKQPPKHKKGT